MYCEEIVKCEDCNDEVKVIYDSRKDKQDSYICKCGKLTIHNIRPHCSFTYGGQCKVIKESYKYEILDSDYFQIDKDIKLLCDDIYNIGHSLDDGYFSGTVSEDSISFSIGDIDERKQHIDAEVYIDLRSDNGWKESEYEKINYDISEKLTNYKEFLIMLKNKEIDLCKPNELWNNGNIKCDGNKEQKKLYDYEFNF